MVSAGTMQPYAISTVVTETIMFWGLVIVGRLSNVWDAFFHSFHKSVKGVVDAHREKEWVFAERNSAPLMFLKGWNLNSESLFTFYPSRNLFSKSPYNSSTNYSSFGNVVSADIQTKDATVYYDLSSFFHSVSWESAPSVRELIIVWGALNNIVVTENFLAKFKFTMLTADGVTVSTMLNNDACFEDFTGWDKDYFDMSEVVADEVVEPDEVSLDDLEEAASALEALADDVSDASATEVALD